jgi:hypothetical protein
MIKRMIISIGTMLIAGVVSADNLRTETLTVTYAPTGTDGSSQKTAISSAFKGTIEEVQVSASSAVGTGTYSIVYAPLAGATAQPIASGTAMTVATKVFRPHVDATGVTGIALTNLASEVPMMVPLTLINESITMTVTNVNPGVSNIVYTAVIKFRKDQ